MKEHDHIEKLFREKLQNLEGDVPASAWENISNQIAATPAAGSAIAKTLSGKLIAGAGIITGAAAIIAGAIYFGNSEDHTNSQQQGTETVSQIGSNEDNASGLSDSEENMAEYNSDKTTSRLKNNNQSAGALQNEAYAGSTEQQLAEESANGEAASSSSNQTSSSQSPSRYGNSPKGPSRIMRGVEQVVNAGANNDRGNAPSGQQTTEVAKANISADKESGDWPLTVQFSNLGTGAEQLWDFGDGEQSTDLSPEHTFKKPGVYTVKLQTSSGRSNAEDKIQITVRSISEIVREPNVFTPNGDGENDLFSIEFKEMRAVTVSISSVNGELVHTWEGPDGSWNGMQMNSGKLLPDGLYYYIIRAVGNDGVVHNKKGSVTLLRSN